MVKKKTRVRKTRKPTGKTTAAQSAAATAVVDSGILRRAKAAAGRARSKLKSLQRLTTTDTEHMYASRKLKLAKLIRAASISLKHRKKAVARARRAARGARSVARAKTRAARR